MLHVTLHCDQWVGCMSVRATIWDEDEFGHRERIAESQLAYFDPVGNSDDLTEIYSAISRWCRRMPEWEGGRRPPVLDK